MHSLSNSDAEFFRLWNRDTSKNFLQTRPKVVIETADEKSRTLLRISAGIPSRVLEAFLKADVESITADGATSGSLLSGCD